MPRKSTGKTATGNRNSGARNVEVEAAAATAQPTSQENFPFQAPSKKKPVGFKTGVLKSRH